MWTVQFILLIIALILVIVCLASGRVPLAVPLLLVIIALIIPGLPFGIK